MTRKDDVFHFEETAAPLLRRYARGLCATCAPAEADDLVQAALERLGIAVRTLDPRAPQAGDARIAAYRALTDLARKKLQGPPQASNHPSAIVHAIADLPFDERATLLLVALEGLSYEDAARASGATRDAVLSRLMRARAAVSGVDLRPSNGARRAGGHLRVVK